MWESWTGWGRFSWLELVIGTVLYTALGVGSAYAIAAWQARGVMRIFRHLAGLAALPLASLPFLHYPFYRTTERTLTLIGPNLWIAGLQVGLIGSLPLWFRYRKKHVSLATKTDFDLDEYIFIAVGMVGSHSAVAAALATADLPVVTSTPTGPDQVVSLQTVVSLALTLVLGALMSFWCIQAFRGALVKSLNNDWNLPSTSVRLVPYLLIASPIIVCGVVSIYFGGVLLGGVVLQLMLIAARWALDLPMSARLPAIATTWWKRCRKASMSGTGGVVID